MDAQTWYISRFGGTSHVPIITHHYSSLTIITFIANQLKPPPFPHGGRRRLKQPPLAGVEARAGERLLDLAGGAWARLRQFAL